MTILFGHWHVLVISDLKLSVIPKVLLGYYIY